MLEGKFKVRWIDTKTATQNETTLERGQKWRNPPLMPHQLICLERGSIMEVSTHDDPNDNYRVQPGDSQS